MNMEIVAYGAAAVLAYLIYKNSSFSGEFKDKQKSTLAYEMA